MHSAMGVARCSIALQQHSWSLQLKKLKQSYIGSAASSRKLGSPVVTPDKALPLISTTFKSNDLTFTPAVTSRLAALTDRQPSGRGGPVPSLYYLATGGSKEEGAETQRGLVKAVGAMQSAQSEIAQQVHDACA